MDQDIYVKNGKDFMIKVETKSWYYCNSHKCQRYYPEVNFYPSHIKRQIKRCKNCMQENIGKNPTTATSSSDESDIDASMYQNILVKLRLDCANYAKENHLAWKKIDISIAEICSLLKWWKAALPEDTTLNIPNDVNLLLWSDTIRTSNDTIHVELYDLVPFPRSEFRNLRYIPVALRPILLQQRNKELYDQVVQIVANIKIKVVSQQQKFIDQLHQQTTTKCN